MSMESLFSQEFVEIAIERIKKFAAIAHKLNYEVAVGFSGGKDSQVVYDLCIRSGIQFKAYYNVSFESPETKKFIKENYPKVIWRRDYKVGFIQNINVHKGLLPTVELAYCCENYKHNPKYIDAATITGVRKQESAKRKKRTTLEVKNKTFRKKNIQLLNE